MESISSPAVECMKKKVARFLSAIKPIDLSGKIFESKFLTWDIVIDDGGHRPEQQIVTLEELLPHIRPGGVFLCEDVHDEFNKFMFYINGLSHRLKRMERIKGH